MKTGRAPERSPRSSIDAATGASLAGEPAAPAPCGVRTEDPDDDVDDQAHDRDLDRHHEEHNGQVDKKAENAEQHLDQHEADHGEQPDGENGAKHGFPQSMSVTAVDDQYARRRGPVSTDTLVVGDGIIGLAIAAELARRGAKVTVLGREQQGAASWASGGLLAPSTGPLPEAVRHFFEASLSAYPAFVAELRAHDPELAVIRGLIELADERRLIDAGAGAADHSLTRAELAGLEPNLPWRPGALLHPHDGAVDARRLLAALRREAESSDRIDFIRNAPATRLDAAGDRLTVRTAGGGTFAHETVVLAAGAWAAQLDGLPRPLPVSPLKGQMVALAGCPLRHPVLAGHTYLVPRGDLTIVGSTSEDVGFDWSTDDATVARLAGVAAQIIPSMAGARVVGSWAGVRPMTPDRMPVIGRDPDVDGLIYACGHSRNGILLAPATAQAVADLATQTVPNQNLGAFAVSRF